MTWGDRESDFPRHLLSWPEVRTHILAPWGSPALTKGSSTWVWQGLVADGLFRETDTWRGAGTRESRQLLRADLHGSRAVGSGRGPEARLLFATCRGKSSQRS